MALRARPEGRQARPRLGRARVCLHTPVTRRRPGTPGPKARRSGDRTLEPEKDSRTPEPSSCCTTAVTDEQRLVERFRTTLDLWAAGVALRRQAIRREHPDASEAEIELRLARWLHKRPGAEHGDGPRPESP
ncbi:MAG: hypothetical protein AB7Q16_12305 [Vicinamibacterales bacterium]